MRLTRRQVALGAGTLVLTVPLGASMRDAASATVGDALVGMTPDRLLSDLRLLCARLHPDTSINVTALQARDMAGAGVAVDLGLHLVWSPGERWVPYSSTAPDLERALIALRDRIATDLIDLHRPLIRGAPLSRHEVKVGWT